MGALEAGHKSHAACLNTPAASQALGVERSLAALKLVVIAQAEVIPTCRELGIAIVPYSPLGRGFLTGNIRSLKTLHESDVRFKISPRFQGENLKKVGLGLACLDCVAALVYDVHMLLLSQELPGTGVHMLCCKHHVCAVIRAVGMIGICM